MAEVKLIKCVPIIQPPDRVVLTLSMEEAAALLQLAGALYKHPEDRIGVLTIVSYERICPALLSIYNVLQSVIG